MLAALTQKFELFADWTKTEWGKTSVINEWKCYTAPALCNTIHTLCPAVQKGFFRKEISRTTLPLHKWKKEKRKEKPRGLKTGEKKSDSCHIPSDKEVRYAWSEVKLQEWSGLCRKWSDREAYSFICDSYNSTKKPKLGVQINVSEADKHQ